MSPGLLPTILYGTLTPLCFEFTDQAGLKAWLEGRASAIGRAPQGLQ